MDEVNRDRKIRASGIRHLWDQVWHIRKLQKVKWGAAWHGSPLNRQSELTGQALADTMSIGLSRPGSKNGIECRLAASVLQTALQGTVIYVLNRVALARAAVRNIGEKV